MHGVIVLASTSPRRRDLLTQIGLPFKTFVSGVKELDGKTCDIPHGELATVNAVLKAKDAAEHFSEAYVIAADTIVTLGNRVLGKPADTDDAVRMLTELSGKTHTVYTGVCLMYRGGCVTFFESADVRMRVMNRSEIQAYADTGEPLDKAGAYGLQGYGAVFVNRVEGDYSTVVGLPLSRLCSELLKLGLDVTKGWESTGQSR